MKDKKKLEKEKKVLLEGEVVEELPATQYKVRADVRYTGKDGLPKVLNPIILCRISGKMRNSFIQLRKGDKVRLEVSLEDVSKGVIVWRKTEDTDSEGVKN